jgi:type IV pilus assembly protein PilV
LIEALFALLVLAVGILGAIALQQLAKEGGIDAIQRTSAAHLAQDIAERIRANPDQLALYATPVGGVGGGAMSAALTAAAAVPPNCTTLACTPDQLVSRDLLEWEQALDGFQETSVTAGGNLQSGGLASPTGCVTPTAAGAVTVAIAWRGLAQQDDDVANACGSGSGLYGANDEFRRVLVINTFIN